MLSKEEGKDQESNQSSTTLDPGHRTKKTKTHHIQGNQEVSPFQTGGHKASRNRHHIMAKANTNKNPQKKHRLGTVIKKKYWRRLKTIPTVPASLNSDVEDKTIFREKDTTHI